MSLYIASINSGSNGNCYYVGNGQDAILVDAGLSCRETEKRMRRLNLSMQEVRGIFISHEHGDHIKGVPVLSAKYNLPVYITERTLRSSRMIIPNHLIRFISGTCTEAINGLSITAFSKEHDAIEPVSFTVAGNGVTIGVFTDLGIACNNLHHHFKQCHAAFLESNYDRSMLMNGRYPIHLKNRISGGKGHLSNEQALEVFLSHRPSFMSHLLLAHLSKENNHPELVADLFNAHADGVEIVVASRYESSGVYHIQAGNMGPIAALAVAPARLKQASLF